MWKCPSCEAQLVIQGSSWRCENGHSFDIAKEGYTNLLLANQKRSKEPGDNKQMINARREFLEKDFYLPLAHWLADAILRHNSKSSLNIFDAGCGEGYYLNIIKEKLSATGSVSKENIHGSGSDISKVAIQKAAKKYKDCDFSVASTFQLPLMDSTQDAVVQIFAPSSESEVRRVLSEGGIWLQANPAPTHLHQLKSMVYDSAQTHETRQDDFDGFVTLEDEEIQFDIELASEQDTLNLLMMTPFYWSASKENLEKIKQELKQVTAHFHITVLQKENRQPD